MYSYDVALNPGTQPAELEVAVKKLGGTFAAEIPQAELQLREIIWTLPGGRGNVRYVYDHFVDVATVRAESPKHGEPAEIAYELSAHIDLRDVDALLKLVGAADAHDRAYALSALAVITPRFYGDVFDAICAALESPDAPMRWVAMKCIARWPYFQFVERLRAHARREDDDALRTETERLAADVEAHGRRGTL